MRGFYERTPDWLMETKSLDDMRDEAERMEQGAYRFYLEAQKQAQDTGIRKLLGDLAIAEQGHSDVASMLEDKHLPEDAREEEDETARRQFVLTYVQPALRTDGRFRFDTRADLRGSLCDAGHDADFPRRPLGLGRCRHFHGLHRGGP